MDSLVLWFCSFISCVIIVTILFQFFDDRYLKVFHSKVLYIILPLITIFVVASVNMFINPFLNFIVNLLWVGAVSFFFYYEDTGKKLIRIFEAEALFVVLAMLEALGVFLIDVVMEIMQIMPDSAELQKSIETAFSKIVLLFLYYGFFSRLWRKNILRTKTQYILYLLMFLYGTVNILIINAMFDKSSPLALVLIIGCTIFVNMYLSYFIQSSDERNYYRLQVEMMQQQEKLQYENYELQNEKYQQAVAILHDVEKHIKMIEDLCQEDLKKDAVNYAGQIREMLQPLVPSRYTGNAVLNCLLSDKKRIADKNGIVLKIEAYEADIGFMRPIDITTLFGNLLDNAIAASKRCKDRKYIGLYMKEYHEMVSIRVENSVPEPVSIKNGKIDSANKNRKGIGLLNIQRCIEAYIGSILYKYADDMLVCDIILNRVEE